MKQVEVAIYVEGPSDKLAMEALLKDLLTTKKQEGVLIRFFHLNPTSPDPKRRGAGKHGLLKKVPERAVNAIRSNPNLIAVVMPDLHPPVKVDDKDVAGKTVQDLETDLYNKFEAVLLAKNLDINLKKRFKVFCFKYDMEALILASENEFKARLGTNSLGVNWKKPVEDQNHDYPPGYVVDEIYLKHKKKYIKTVEAPAILGKCDYKKLTVDCPQCFKPFVDFLESL